MHITFDGGDHNLALGLRLGGMVLHVFADHAKGLLRRIGRLDQLRKIHGTLFILRTHFIERRDQNGVDNGKNLRGL